MTIYTSQPDGANGIDTFMQSEFPTNNNGTSTNFYVGKSTTNIHRGLIKFDLSSIQPNAEVISASLFLTQTSEGAVNNRTMRVFRQKRAWTEAGATWNKYDGTNNWGTAGGFNLSDCEQTDIGSISLSSTEANGEKEIVLTATAIQEMVSGDFANNGFLVKNDTENEDYHVFASSDNATAGYRPKLVIEYILGGQVMIWSSE